jgi:membrane-associated protein
MRDLLFSKQGRKMGNLGGPSAQGWVRRITILLLVLFLFSAALPCLRHVCASTPESNTAVSEEGQPGFFIQIFRNIFNSHELMKILQKPEFTILSFVALNLIVFIETGLLVGFFLPGDSLLVTAGLVCAGAPEWNLPLLLFTLCLSAILGDSVGYTIGWKTGPKIFCRERSFFFHKDHLLKAQDFYQKHGGKTIILARFMPIIRTFAPVVAGVGKMEYRKFLFFNIFGGIGWVVSMILFGYYLPALINPALKPIFGDDFAVQDHIEKVVILVVLLSISPGIFLWLRSKWKGKPAVAQPTAENPTAQLVHAGK